MAEFNNNKIVGSKNGKRSKKSKREKPEDLSGVERERAKKW